MILSLRVEETKPTTKEAQQTVDKKIAQIKSILDTYNIPKSDVKTTNVSSYESFDWRDS
ncbi:SIMPL domain-containing protein [bacterium]|nr:SIMPL domain-containing protein [bacterium]